VRLAAAALAVEEAGIDARIAALQWELQAAAADGSATEASSSREGERVVHRQSGPAASRGGGPALRALARLGASARRSAFNQWDVNGNGGLSLAEIDKAMVAGYPEYDNKPALMRAYKAADQDGNGFITRREFKKLLHFIGYFTDLWDTFEGMDKEGDRRLTLAEFAAASARVGHEASAAELSRDFGRLDRSGVGAVLFEDFCGWCAHRHVGTDFADSDEEDGGRTAHCAAPSPHRAEPAQAPCDSGGGGSPPERLALRAALDEDVLAQRYHAGIPPEVPVGGGIALDHDILAPPLDHRTPA
jgi:Ca2+-binding EF-hand superfamily protein